MGVVFSIMRSFSLKHYNLSLFVILKEKLKFLSLSNPALVHYLELSPPTFMKESRSVIGYPLMTPSGPSSVVSFFGTVFETFDAALKSTEADGSPLTATSKVGVSDSKVELLAIVEYLFPAHDCICKNMGSVSMEELLQELLTVLKQVYS